MGFFKELFLIGSHLELVAILNMLCFEEASYNKIKLLLNGHK